MVSPALFEFISCILHFPGRSCSTQSQDGKVVENPKAARIKLQNDLFNAERLRQEKNVGRIEKITVQYKGQPKDLDLVMNKNVSTPYNCAQRWLFTGSRI